MQVEKYYNEQGDVAMLYFPSYGAGWSTWTTGDEEFMMFDKTLVQYALDAVEEGAVVAYMKTKGVEAYTGGWKDIRVEFLPKGTQFIIEEYDGNESISILDKIKFNVA